MTAARRRPIGRAFMPAQNTVAEQFGAVTYECPRGCDYAICSANALPQPPCCFLCLCRRGERVVLTMREEPK